ncbi:MAG: RNA-binding cell elongation regulator Jag/EloR [Candidatus Cloacimonadaceae bacterium]
MKQIERKGTDLNAIISKFRQEHKIKDWELQYEIVSEGSKGLFGLLGKKQAAVRFNLLTTEERVKLFLEQLLTHMELRFDSITTQTEQKTVYVTIHNSSDAGFLIGKNGNMLEQLQYLVNRVFENVKDLERIYLDTEDYRLRQEQAFLRTFIPIINKVKATGKSVTLEPMQGGERRIIHKYVEGEPALKTMTMGEGDSKRIVIMPADKKEPAPAKAKPARRAKPEQTPEQHANQSYQRHNKAHPASKTSQRPRKAEKAKTPRV